MKWNEITTAPKDGTPIIALMPWPQFKHQHTGTLRWGQDAFGEWRWLGNESVPPKNGNGAPIGWMPLPETSNEKIEVPANGERQKGTEL